MQNGTIKLSFKGVETSSREKRLGELNSRIPFRLLGMVCCVAFISFVLELAAASAAQTQRQQSAGNCSPVIQGAEKVTIEFRGSGCNGIDPALIEKLNEFLADFPASQHYLLELLSIKDKELEEKIKEADSWANKYRDLSQQIRSFPIDDELSRKGLILLQQNDLQGVEQLLRQLDRVVYSQKLAAQAEELVSTNQSEALNLALESWQIGKTREASAAVGNSWPQLSFAVHNLGSREDVKFSPDGHRIVTISDDHSAQIWDVNSSESLVTLKHPDRISKVKFSPDGRWVVTTSEDQTARVWSVKSGETLATLKHPNRISEVEFSPDGKRILTLSDDNTARVWNSATGENLVTVKHDSKIWKGAFSPNGDLIVTSSQHVARVWNSSTGQLVATLDHPEDVSFFCFSPDGQRIVSSSSYDNTASVWVTASGIKLATLKHEEFLPNTRTTIAFVHDHDDDTTSDPYEDDIREAHNAELLSKLGFEGIARSEMRKARIVVVPDGVVSSAVFSPDGQRIVTASADHTARIWNAANGQLLAILKHGGKVLHAEFSPDSQQVITLSDDAAIARVWSVARGELVATLEHRRLITQVNFSSDSHWIVTASEDHTARIWSAANGQLVATLKHRGPVWQAAFSPDSQHILTTSEDAASRAVAAEVWNSSSGQLLATTQKHGGSVRRAVFSPDGRHDELNPFGPKEQQSEAWALRDSLELKSNRSVGIVR